MMSSINFLKNHRYIHKFGLPLISIALLFEAGLSYASTCITTNLLNLNGTHTKVLPFGCALTNSTPFTFTAVSDGNSNQIVIINTFEQFASTNGVSGVFISGTIGVSAFSGIASQVHPSDTLGNLILPVPTTNYPITLTSELITPTANSTLPPNFLMQLDPTKTSDGFYSVVNFGTPVNGVQSYQVTDDFNLNFQASLDTGATWVSNDPLFGLSNFDPNENSQIQSFIAISSVPVPAALPLMASGLAAFGLGRRRNKLV